MIFIGEGAEFSERFRVPYFGTNRSTRAWPCLQSLATDHDMGFVSDSENVHAET
jgi:hypothetical protein